MIEVKVTLEIPGVPEALNHLADAIASQDLGCKSGKAMDAINKRLTAAMDAAKVEVPVAQPAPAQTATAAPVAPAAPEPVQTPAAPFAPTQAAPASAPTPAPQPTPAPAAQPAPAPAQAPAKKYTRDEIAHAGSALVSQGKMPQLLALLNKYGVQSVVQLDPNKYDAFASDLRALGAAL